MPTTPIPAHKTIVNSRITTLLDCLPSTLSPALYSPDLSRRPLLHDTLRYFVQHFVLPHSASHDPLGPNDRVMIVLPTGPENALALLSLASYHTCAPVNASCTAAELLDDARRLNAKAIVTTRDAEERLELRLARRKSFRYSLLALIVGTSGVIESWDLQECDVKPEHDASIPRWGDCTQPSAPIFSGGSTIMCAGFDAMAFWTLAVICRPAGIVPLARPSELNSTFDAVILPSYGMTECMPIATPPITYQLERPGCSGIACGPHLSVRESCKRRAGAPRRCHWCHLRSRVSPPLQGYETSPDPHCAAGHFGVHERGGGLILGTWGTWTRMDIYLFSLAIDHDVLQEAIGIVVVPLPGRPQITYTPSKWPFVLVCMDDVPQNAAGKPLRIKLATRLALGQFSDEIAAHPTTFRALDLDAIHSALVDVSGVSEAALRVRADGAVDAFVAAHEVGAEDIGAALALMLPGYAVPQPIHVLVGRDGLLRTSMGKVDFVEMEAEMARAHASVMSEQALLVRDIHRQFAYGGNYVGAFFEQSEATLNTLDMGYDYEEDLEVSQEKTRGQTHPISMIVQGAAVHVLLPAQNCIDLDRPSAHALGTDAVLNGTFWERIGSLLCSIVVARLTTRIVAPITAILFKWLVIGKYKPGTYRMWSTYHLRWWIVNQSLRISGRGIFSMHPSLEILYYRLLGARIRAQRVHRERARSSANSAWSADSGWDGCYGPHASSHDNTVAPDFFRIARVQQTLLSEPNFLLKLLVAWPVMFASVLASSYIPWLFAIYSWSQMSSPSRNDLNATRSRSSTGYSTPERIAYHALSRILRT
ncbi:hypothetical protein B0H14DRAFT_3651598, partial [Mycena olivaceomarginata]